MLDIKFIKENIEIVKTATKNKRREIDFDRLLALDEERLVLMRVVEEFRAKQNEMSDKIVQSDADTKAQIISEMKTLKGTMAEEEEKLKVVSDELQKIMLSIPNFPSPDTPVGDDDSGNIVIRSWGEKPVFSFTPKEHFDICEKLGLIDTEKAGQISGSRFAYLKGDLVLMQFAIIQLCYSILTDKTRLEEIAEKAGVKVVVKPFVPVVPPVFVRPLVQVRMARFLTPEDHYMFPEDDLMLIGSAEHTLGPLHMDEIFDESDLPIRYAGYSTAFRREAGTYGKDTNGILRQHQFDKLELEVFSLPEHSLEEQNFLVAIQEHILQTINLPYEVLSVCTGDMGFPDYRQIDINTWMPGQNKYRETHSADHTGGFQARRLNTRVKRKDGKNEPVHMNDATAVAIGRILIAIIENYQNEDGSITVPLALRPYLNKEKIG